MNTHNYSDKPAFTNLADIKGKKVTVMGLGLNGGGEATVRFLVKHGAFVTITDMKTQEQLATTIDSLNSDTSLDHSLIKYVLGKHDIEDFKNADVVIKNPGVKYDNNQYLAAAKQIETDISIFLAFTKAPIIAVTGSKGKSSTVSAIHYGLTQAGFTSFLGGNITVSPLTFLEKTTEKTPVVLELSSWQLSDLRGRKLLKPHICVITKIVSDHQNWYGNMESYVNDKRLIYADQTKEDYTILTCDDDWGKSFASQTYGTIINYSAKTPKTQNFIGGWLDSDNKGWIKLDSGKEKLVLDKTVIPGQHMKENLVNAAIVMSLMEVPSEKIKSILAEFPGIQHRLEYFHQWKNKHGVEFKFYNDSAATVPEAAQAALEAFDKNVFFLCGGTDKQLDFTPLANTIGKAYKLFLLNGTGTEKLLPLIKEKNISFNGPYNSLNDLLAATKTELEKQSNIENPVVVFSPGATSFGMFNNEFDRGNKFKKSIEELF